jgi:hypothetical protein
MCRLKINKKYIPCTRGEKRQINRSPYLPAAATAVLGRSFYMIRLLFPRNLQNYKNILLHARKHLMGFFSGGKYK